MATYLTDITQQAAESLAMQHARSLDAALQNRISELEPGWTPESLRGRLMCTHTPDGIESYTLDGILLLKAGPLRTEQHGTRLEAFRELWLSKVGA